MTYSELKTTYEQRTEGQTFDERMWGFCKFLATTDFRWFLADINGRSTFLRVEPCGTKWTLLHYKHAGAFTVEVGPVSQQTVWFAKPITEEEFNRSLRLTLASLIQ